jgi:hypothetical protein
VTTLFRESAGRYQKVADPFLDVIGFERFANRLGWKKTKEMSGLEDVDTNEDGVLSGLEDADTNKDGVLSGLEDVDTNEDGVLSEKEMLDMLRLLPI